MTSSSSAKTNLERRIIIGLIVSSEYITQINRVWNPQYLQSSAAKRIATWCMEYFDKYQKAPFSDIEGIYFEKLRQGNLPKELAEEIEEDILPGLDEEYERENQFNYQYLLDQTRQYFRERHLILYSEQIKALVDEGELQEAEIAAASYHNSPDNIEVGLDLSTKEALEKVENAFNQTLQRVVTYPGPLGEMWNDQLIRGGFVALMGPEKRGKTFWLLDLAMRGITKKANVAFFQAGDMTEAQQLKRICIYLAKKSDKQKYCGSIYLPIKDCLLHQFDNCDHVDREHCESIRNEFEGTVPFDIRHRLTASHLENLFQEHQNDYVPCKNCNKHQQGHGSIWLTRYNTGAPLQAKEAKQVLQAFFQKYKKRFKLSTHPSKTLSIKGIKSILDTWEKQDGFVPDLILIDYADLLAPDTTRMEFRHQQDDIWAKMRGLSEERHSLVATATQADAASYEQDTIYLKNFSEDKRKYAHVTAMYGLNQDKKGREKKLGLMRINELVVREDDFSNDNQVYVMQKLQIGRPFLGSFK